MNKNPLSSISKAALTVAFVAAASLVGYSSAAGYGGGIPGAFVYFPQFQPQTPTPTPVAIPPVIGGSVLGVSTFTFTLDLKLGSTGDEVTELQKVLIAAGFLKGAPTGYFGTLTKAAVKAYQKDHGIVPASGFVGPMTRTVLNGGQNASTPGTTLNDSDRAAWVRGQITMLLEKIKELQAKLASSTVSTSTASSTTGY